MLNRKLTAISLIAATTIGIAGCSEENTQNPNASDSTESTTMVTESESESESPEITNKPADVTDKPADVNSRINMELLSELGMTFEELEEKYGSVVSHEKVGDDYIVKNPSGDVISRYAYFAYYFENGQRGYTFSINEADIRGKHRTFPDGTPIPFERDHYVTVVNLQAKDFLLDMEEPMTVEDFIEAISQLGEHTTRRIPEDPSLDTSHLPKAPFVTSFWYYNGYHLGGTSFNIGHNEEELITPDSVLWINHQG
ncbi:MAG: hypothetical protein FWG83_04465 [Oscillospiraceae bacterium]|nr:hypothetical protein [Oscillospiraceae bacterium]